MAQIRTKNGAMAVTFGKVDQVRAEQPGFSGLVSQASWDNPDLMKGLRQMFACRDGEVITAIEVDHHGIKARFERVQIVSTNPRGNDI